MKSFFKFLSRNKLYTFIELLGLSIAMTLVIFAGKYAMDELTCDSFHKDKENLLMLCSNKMAWRSAAVEPYLDGRYPEIECMSIFIASTVSVDTENGNDAKSLRGAYVDSCFIKMI